MFTEDIIALLILCSTLVLNHLIDALSKSDFFKRSK